MSPIQISLGGYQGPNSVHTYGAQVFCDALHRLAGDAVQVSFLPDITTTGRPAAQLLPLTEQGEFDACYFSSSYIAHKVSALTLFDLLFAVPEKATTFELLDSAPGELLAREVAENSGYIALGYWDNGLRHMTAADRVLATPADCDGLKLRILPNENHHMLFEALGFQPQVIDVKDVEAAVNGGQVNAQENPLTNTYNMGLSKSQRFVTLSGHLMGISLVLFNRKTFESWPADIRQMVQQAVDEATTAQRARAAADEQRSIAAMQADGVQFFELTADQRAAFKSAVAPEVARLAADLNPELLTLFNVRLEDAS
ncbi:C4-dicarboxylate-binding protein DctP [Monaibacterium marinum]|uniref:C4-dicarboxylate-binding protein DctP n=1 Tax=Pontivivens marinum TaxID=1690039 RepID=A0A2C9CUJ0_9RHOB|nr:TRAP transporter substrate-binding protein [Monaibacterium marinum]SOH94917.1 C4-dicarboxylate-binding protein DctP [Monaibacterium marinum]